MVAMAMSIEQQWEWISRNGVSMDTDNFLFQEKLSYLSTKKLGIKLGAPVKKKICLMSLYVKFYHSQLLLHSPETSV